MKTRILGLGLSMAFSVVGGAYLSTSAYADSTCYTGCTAPTDPGAGTSQATTTANVVTDPSSGSLPFTGADIAEMAGIGAALVGAGGLLVARGRRRTTASTPR